MSPNWATARTPGAAQASATRGVELARAEAHPASQWYGQPPPATKQATRENAHPGADRKGGQISAQAPKLRRPRVLDQRSPDATACRRATQRPTERRLLTPHGYPAHRRLCAGPVCVAVEAEGARRRGPAGGQCRAGPTGAACAATGPDYRRARAAGHERAGTARATAAGGRCGHATPGDPWTGGRLAAGTGRRGPRRPHCRHRRRAASTPAGAASAWHRHRAHRARTGLFPAAQATATRCRGTNARAGNGATVRCVMLAPDAGGRGRWRPDRCLARLVVTVVIHARDDRGGPNRRGLERLRQRNSLDVGDVVQYHWRCDPRPAAHAGP